MEDSPQINHYLILRSIAAGSRYSSTISKNKLLERRVESKATKTDNIEDHGQTQYMNREHTVLMGKLKEF